MIFKFTLILFSLFFFGNFHKAQSATRMNTLKKVTKKDFNNDKIRDYIVVMEDRCTNSNYTEDDFIQCRWIDVELKGKDGKHILSTSNHYIVPCSNCSEDITIDPFKDLKVKKNRFSIVLAYKLVPEGTKIGEVITFKYDKLLNNFILHKKVSTIESYKNGEFETKTVIQTVKDFGLIYFSDYR